MTDGTNDIPEVLGGFWSKIPRDTNNDKRDPVDQARMQLLQQLLAAILNQEAFGTDYNNLVSDAIANFASNDKALLLQLAGDIAFINEGSGFGEQQLPGDFVKGTADPKNAKGMADKPEWDVLP